eukprot:scaffold1237_cov243-Pinguiococcus_pyrenoidosus.AAC.11
MTETTCTFAGGLGGGGKQSVNLSTIPRIAMTFLLWISISSCPLWCRGARKAFETFYSTALARKYVHEVFSITQRMPLLHLHREWLSSSDDCRGWERWRADCETRANQGSKP